MTMLKATLCATAGALMILGSASAAPGFGADSWSAASSGSAKASTENSAADLMMWLRGFVLGEKVEVKTTESKESGETVVSGGAKGVPASQKPAQPKTDEERIADSQKAPQPLPLAF